MVLPRLHTGKPCRWFEGAAVNAPIHRAWQSPAPPGAVAETDRSFLLSKGAVHAEKMRHAAGELSS